MNKELIESARKIDLGCNSIYEGLKYFFEHQDVGGEDELNNLFMQFFWAWLDYKEELKETRLINEKLNRLKEKFR